MRITMIAVILKLFTLPCLVYASGSAGGSGGGAQGAQTGSTPTFDSNFSKRIITGQERKIAEANKNKVVTYINMDHSHKLFDQVLIANVKKIKNGYASQFDYKNLDHGQLVQYLNLLSSVPKEQYNSFQRDQKLAFLINAYNAFTLELIVKNYPVSSIKELGFLWSSPWKKKFIPLLGEILSLDNIEQDLIRSDYFQEPRIHFAVNCASIGCPALQDRAFTADNLENQLAAATKSFFSDRDRNYISGTTLFVSKILDWYGEDFKKGWGGYVSVQDFILKNGQSVADSPEDIKKLNDGQLRIKYTDYNWSLNDVEKSAAGK